MSQRRAAAPLPPVAWLGVLGFIVVELAVSGRYGFHRDELYFIACARHLAWGYVDQPPLAPALVRVSLLWGDNPVAVRILPALAGAGVVLVAALFARDFGGRRFAIGLTALLTATMPVLLGAAHLAGTTPYDLLAWALTLLLVTRAVRGDRSPNSQHKLWLAAGVVAGVGLLNKHTIATFLLPGLVVALALSPQRRLLASRWPWLAGLIALAIGSPTLIWQAMNGWPEFTMFHSLQTQHSATSDAIKFLPAQVLYADPVVAPIWIAGVVRLFRASALRDVKFLGWLYVVLIVVVQLTVPGKPYYVSALYLPLFAAGSCWIETRARKGFRLPRLAWPPIIAVGAIICALIALPILPIRFWHAVSPNSINYDQGEQIAWPRMVGQVGAAYSALPASQRQHTDIFTSNYGEAGAIDRYGKEFGLPNASSGHNAFWTWGPPADSPSSVLIVGDRAEQFSSWCDSLVVVGKLSNVQGVQNDEYDAPLTLCTGFNRSWASVWPALKHFN
jgi:4-amino-4-deoxy-L-arabinose transferase-like glycosyltransferase